MKFFNRNYSKYLILLCFSSFIVVTIPQTYMGISPTVSHLHTEEHTLTIPTILHPEGGETFGGVMIIEWIAANDTMGHEVTYSVDYSLNGDEWVEIVSDFTDTKFEWPTHELITNSKCLIRVTATCSQGLVAEAISEGFTINNLQDHAPIFIDENSDFEQLGFPGSGTIENPFLIENMFISASLTHLIHIQGITADFIIRNNWLDGFSGESIGIHLVDTENGLIESNTIHNCNNGVLIASSTNNKISMNYISHNQENGILLVSTKSNIIANNTIHTNVGHGIFLENSDRNIITQNEVFSNGHGGSGANVLSPGAHGIYLDPANFNTISTNIIYDNAENGIYLFESDSTQISKNEIFENGYNGVFLEDSDSNIISDNDIFNNGYGGGTGSRIMNPGAHGIYLDPARKNTIKSNKVHSNADNGIFLNMSENSSISNNEVYNNGLNGVSLQDSDNNSIMSNEIYHNGYGGGVGSGINSPGAHGIYLDPASSNVISDNIIYNNSDMGVYLFKAVDTNITSNTIYSNGDTGIALKDSDDNNIIGNDIHTNGKGGEGSRVNSPGAHGIYLDPSHRNHISYNTISDHSSYGVFITLSNDNLVDWNDFIGNNPEGESQAYDDGVDNIFSNNYWKDHDNTDTNGDGIADAEYIIDGAASNRDIFPMIDTDKTTTQKTETEMTSASGWIFTVIFVSMITWKFRRRKT
ncbi:MAG: right-handed parallel beta-helix repeat-containing protein [Candidatus Heimdallarchaeota archaeon]|nr:MAG: right-handed parallel beta-helix repeat-containing protein [Candidatus Heimdallarchaeota archaeon]